MRRINLRGQAGKNVPPVDRFWLQVRKGSGCWVWIGNLDIGGYGRIVVHGRKMKSHRYSWQIHFGPIPPGMLVCHKCDRPACVRPDHLFLGTNLDNRRDSVDKDRHNSGHGCGELNGNAKLTQEAVDYIRKHHRRRSRGEFRTNALAARFGVLPEAIRSLLRGQTWGRDTKLIRYRD